MERILLDYGFPKENTKVKVRSPDGDTDFFDIVAGVLQGETLAPYLFITYQDYVLRTSIYLMKENSFTLKMQKSRRYSAETITDADYANDIALLANTRTQAESLLHSLERAACCINTEKTEYTCFNKKEDTSTQNGSSLDKSTYLGSSVTSTENDINMRIAKAWTAIDRLAITWKSSLYDRIKHIFFRAVVVSILFYGCTI